MKGETWMYRKEGNLLRCLFEGLQEQQERLRGTHHKVLGEPSRKGDRNPKFTVFGCAAILEDMYNLQSGEDVGRLMGAFAKQAKECAGGKDDFGDGSSKFGPYSYKFEVIKHCWLERVVALARAAIIMEKVPGWGGARWKDVERLVFATIINMRLTQLRSIPSPSHSRPASNTLNLPTVTIDRVELEDMRRRIDELESRSRSKSSLPF